MNPALDYNNYNQAELYAPGPFASSDHDPVIIGLELDAPVQDPEELLRLLRWDVYYAYRDGELRRPDMYVLQNRLLTASFFLRHDREFLAELFVKQFIRDVERLERKHRLDSDVADAFIADAEMVLTQLNH